MPLAAWSTDRENLFASSSGGVWYELAQEMIRRGGLVVGVVMAGTEAKYVITKDTNVVKAMRGSKYVPSSPMKLIRHLKSYMPTPLLFTGLPCHIEMLKRACDTTNIVTVDLRCHGLPPMRAFGDHLQTIAGDREIRYIRFRDKSAGWEPGQISQRLIVEFTNGEVYDEYDEYIQGYLNGSLLRSSCRECHLSRTGDITLGDYWEIPTPQKNRLGTSLVHLNTPKGKMFFEGIESIRSRRIMPYHYLNLTDIDRLGMAALKRCKRMVTG